MQLSSSEIITTIILATLIFILAPIFLVLYVRQYNLKKIKHLEEKKKMAELFENELLRTQVEVQEQTMQTIASNLHDNIGQLLSLTALTLNSIQIVDDQIAARKVGSSIDLVNKSVKELRELAKLFHAEQLLNNGIGNAIEQEVNFLKKSELYQISFRNELKDFDVRSPQKDIVTLRLFQELTNNVIKHARANEIEVALIFADNTLRLDITDNGIGFDYQTALQEASGLGLYSMKNRIELINGTLNVDSKINHGTTTTVTIPYP